MSIKLSCIGYDTLFTNLAMEYHKSDEHFNHLSMHLMHIVYFFIKILNDKSALPFMIPCSQVCE